jgi:hypothetical protein
MVAGAAMMVSSTLPAAPATPNLSTLPPPASRTIEFDRDIRPILDGACLKCHGPERPKGRFRLDERTAALKGGGGGADIVPGRSADSPLIHFVARLVPDKEMPPEGKGTPLTPGQIALLRAWIDQGAKWGVGTNGPRHDVRVETGGGGTWVNGNAAKFREHYGVPEGANGGLVDLHFEDRTSSGTRIDLGARALRDDYAVRLSVDRPDVGSVRVGWEQRRRYEADTGGYQPRLGPYATTSLGRDLHLDTGRAWADFTLALPAWPVITIGYELQYRDGERALTAWGPVSNGAVTNNIHPSFESLRETVHVLKLDLDHTVADWRFQDSFRGEFHDLSTDRHLVTFDDVTGPGVTSRQDASETARHFQGANAFRVERQFRDWLFGSAGYLYSRLTGDSSIGLTGTYWSYSATPSDGRLVSQQIVLDRESHVVNLNTLLGPWEGLTLTLGAQAEWTRQTGFGNAVLNSALIADEAEVMSANSRRQAAQETAALRYTRLPGTVLFAEVQLRQESTDLFQSQSGGLGFGYDFLRDAGIAGESRDWRVGFNTTPTPRVTFGGHFRCRDYSDHFDNRQDTAFGFPNSGYPAFIRSRETRSDEVEGRCTLRVTSWLKSTWIYRWTDTDYYTATDPEPLFPSTPGGGQYSGRQEAHQYAWNVAVSPWKGMTLSGTASYRHSRTTTARNDIPSVVPFRGDLYSAVAGLTQGLTPKTELTANYHFSRSTYARDNAALAPVLGLDYELHGVEAGVSWRFRPQTTFRLQYGCYTYDEQNTGGWNNYVAQTVFATLSVRLP